MNAYKGGLRNHNVMNHASSTLGEIIISDYEEYRGRMRNYRNLKYKKKRTKPTNFVSDPTDTRKDYEPSKFSVHLLQSKAWS